MRKVKGKEGGGRLRFRQEVKKAFLNMDDVELDSLVRYCSPEWGAPALDVLIRRDVGKAVALLEEVLEDAPPKAAALCELADYYNVSVFLELLDFKKSAFLLERLSEERAALSLGFLVWKDCKRASSLLTYIINRSPQRAGRVVGMMGKWERVNICAYLTVSDLATLGAHMEEVDFAHLVGLLAWKSPNLCIEFLSSLPPAPRTLLLHSMPPQDAKRVLRQLK